jgi:HK97 family phage prohead protease
MPKVLISFGEKKAAPPKKSPASLEGKTVRYRIGEGVSAVDVVGFVKRQTGGTLEIAPTIPNANGVLFVAKDATLHIPVSDAEVIDMQCRANCGVKAFETSDPLEGQKAAQELKQDGILVDYRGVTFEGYGSTFQKTTPADRDGDYILEGAFDRSLQLFKDNPVMLTDHTRSVRNLMGHYDKIGITARGLALRGVVTDSPHMDAVHVRFQLMEKSLRTLSIGGFFFYLEDYRGIEDIELHETSLVVIPANPDANFQVRSLTEEVIVKAFTRFLSLNGGELRTKQAA